MIHIKSITLDPDTLDTLDSDTLDTLEIDSIPFFSSSDMQKLHHLLGYHHIGIILHFFLKCFAFFKFTMPS